MQKKKAERDRVRTEKMKMQRLGVKERRKRKRLGRKESRLLVLTFPFLFSVGRILPDLFFVIFSHFSFSFCFVSPK